VRDGLVDHGLNVKKAETHLRGDGRSRQRGH
jgi:hypothetical protein